MHRVIVPETEERNKMPNVNGKKFPYTPAGIKAAKVAAKKKPGGSGGIKDAPKRTPSDFYKNIGQKAVTLPSKSSKTKKM